MAATAHDQYLATQIKTATPQKLRLMLIEGAIRWGEQTKRCWEDGNPLAGDSPFLRCHAILGELLAAARSSDVPLARKVGSLYTYLFRTWTESLRDHDLKKAADVLSVLRMERETWRQVCAQFGADKPGDENAAAPLHRVTGRTGTAPSGSVTPTLTRDADRTGPGLSIEA